MVRYCRGHHDPDQHRGQLKHSTVLWLRRHLTCLSESHLRLCHLNADVLNLQVKVHFGRLQIYISAWVDADFSRGEDGPENYTDETPVTPRYTHLITHQLIIN